MNLVHLNTACRRAIHARCVVCACSGRPHSSAFSAQNEDFSLNFSLFCMYSYWIPVLSTYEFDKVGNFSVRDTVGAPLNFSSRTSPTQNLPLLSINFGQRSRITSCMEVIHTIPGELFLFPTHLVSKTSFYSEILPNSQLICTSKYTCKRCMLPYFVQSDSRELVLFRFSDW